MSGIEHASNQSIKPFRSSEEYLYAMKEDLAEWLKDLYSIDIDVNNMVDVLETGALLCAHANHVTRVAAEFGQRCGRTHLQLPASGVTFISSAQPATFLARDNVSNFIDWCRNQMHVNDVLMFETDDLVLRKNEKNFVLCLLEVARRASRFGMAAPVLIQLEQEIEEEIEEQMKPVQDTTPPVKRLQNSQNLDEMVQYLMSRCTCPTQFPMVKISDGKYRVGDSNTLIFVRILRNHVMVRVGGGWDTLEHYLDKHDPCRCTSLTHKLAHRPATPVHEIKARPCGPDGEAGSQTALLLTRVQSPMEPVLWSPSAPCRTQKESPQPRLCRSPDPSLRNCPSPNKLKNRAVILPCRQIFSNSKDDSVLKSTCRTGREATRASPSPRQASSLPRPTRPSTPPQPEMQRPITPPGFHRTQSQTSLQHQPSSDKRCGQNWTKSQFVSKLRHTASAGPKNQEERQSLTPGLVLARPSQCITPVLKINTNKNSLLTQPPNVNEVGDTKNAKKNPDFIRTFCPSKGLMGVVSGKAHDKCLTPKEKEQQNGSSEPLAGIIRNLENERTPQRCSTFGERMQFLDLPLDNMQGSQINMNKSGVQVSGLQQSETVTNVDLKKGDWEMENRYIFSPPPISPAQEAVLYQSLEEEILSNLQELGMDSDASDYENKPRYNNFPDISVNSPKLSYEIQIPSAPMSSSSPKPNDAKGAKAVIGGFSNGNKLLEKVSLESWVNTLSIGCRGKKQESLAATHASQVNVSKPFVASSWSSQDSSIDSKDLVDPSKFSEAKAIVETANNSGTCRQGKLWGYSFHQKRSLKKPERVPSIYKLKLRPHIQPRRDHRPDKKPSKIPKPISYRDSQCLGDASQAKMPADNTARCHSLKGHNPQYEASTMRQPAKNSENVCKLSPTAARCAVSCQEIDQRKMTDRDLETWV